MATPQEEIKRKLPVARGDTRLHSKEIVNICTKWIKELQENYSFFIE